MKFIYLGIFSVCVLLGGCEKPTDEMEDLELMVQLEEEEKGEWNLSESKVLGQETPVLEIPQEDFR